MHLIKSMIDRIVSGDTTSQDMLIANDLLFHVSASVRRTSQGG
jgi:hypothetical protein